MRVQTVFVVEGKFRFHGIPKCGSRSAEVLLQGDSTRTYPCDTNAGTGSEPRIALVRHPLERLRSLYNFVYVERATGKPEQTIYVKEYLYPAACEFEQFLDHALDKFFLDRHTIYQAFFVGPRRPDYVGPLRDFDKVAGYLLKKFDLKGSIEHANRTNDRGPRCDRSYESLVEQTFALDMDLWERAQTDKTRLEDVV